MEHDDHANQHHTAKALLDDIREQLAADVFQFRTEAEQKAATLSVPDYFFWHKGIEDSLTLSRQQLYARFGRGDSISYSLK